MLISLTSYAYGLIKTMVKPTDTFKNRHEYIPPSVQQSLANHMQTSMPAHLKKYQEPGQHITPHAERAMADHMQKTLPGHLKQYGSAYVQQNVVQPNSSRSTIPTTSVSNSTSGAPVPGGPRQNQAVPSLSQPSPPQNSSGGSQYDFILNPEQPARTSMLTLPDNKFQKILIIIAAVVLLIVVFIVGNSFLSSSANAHNEKLLGLAKTQTEITRIIDEANDKISDQELRNLSLNAKLSLTSTKSETISSLASRGKKVKDNELKSVNADNDKVLTEGEQNNRFDQTYKQLLEQQLNDYQKQLSAVYESGNSTEKEFTLSASNQLNLLLGKKQATQ